MFLGLKFVCVRKRQGDWQSHHSALWQWYLVFLSDWSRCICAPYVLLPGWSIGCRSLWKLWSTGHSRLLNDSGKAYCGEILVFGNVLATWRWMNSSHALSRKCKWVETVHILQLLWASSCNSMSYLIAMCLPTTRCIARGASYSSSQVFPILLFVIYVQLFQDQRWRYALPRDS